MTQRPAVNDVNLTPAHPKPEPGPSPFVAIFKALGEHNPAWRADIGPPQDPGWISGTSLRRATEGPPHELLLRIGTRVGTSDRRTIAALFALRYGWTSVLAVAAYLRHDAVPDVSLENISLKFKENTFFERLALHVPRGAMKASDPASPHPSVEALPSDPRSLLGCLRRRLVEQAQPVVEALHDWSGFAPRGTWGMLTSSWAAHFTAHFGEAGEQSEALPILSDFFAGDDLVAAMQPRFHLVTYGEVTQVYQRRASCCRYYLVPRGDLCASCPLVSHEERVQRNRAWMKSQMDATVGKGHHT